MEDIIKQMLLNQISMKDFLDIVFTNPDLISSINSLVPKEAVNNCAHPLWTKFSYAAMEKASFKLWDEIKNIAKFNNTLGDNLNIFGNIKYFYCYAHPGFQPTSKYEDEFNLLLDVAGESYGGPEVDGMINDIISEYACITPKTRRIREAKEKIALTFHVFEKKRPRWINGAEWPMGISSPMQFVESKLIKEGKAYSFQDVDTGDIRTIVQYY